MMPLPPNMTRSIMHSASEAGGSAQENLLRQLVGAVPEDDRAPLLAAMLDQLGEGTDGLARLFRAAIAQRGGADAAVTHMRSQLSASAGRPGDAALTELAGTTEFTGDSSWFADY